jgi:hypothetical protein
MNDEQHAFWLGYIRQLADLMQLKDWDIDLSRGEPQSNTADAEICTYYGQRGAAISLPVKFFAQSPERQRYFIAHELMHCHSEDLSECIRLYINHNGHMDDLIAQVYRREEEVLVDNLARVIAPFLPLPETHVRYWSSGINSLPNGTSPLPRGAATDDPYEHRIIVNHFADDGNIATKGESITDIVRTQLSANGLA